MSGRPRSTPRKLRSGLPPAESPVTNAYYVDRPLTTAEIAEVRELTDLAVAQHRVPCVLPMPDRNAGGKLTMPSGAEDAPLGALRAAGILRDSGRRVFLVALDDLYWNAQFVLAIARLIGRHPLLIQTESQRAHNMNPGPLRILDMEGALG